MHDIRLSPPLHPGTPLWQRAPTRDEYGGALSDFVMILPALKNSSQSRIRNVVDTLADILDRYKSVVVFADYNMRLHTLWVSVRPVPGICLELPAIINHHIPEARLINQRA